MAACLSCKIHSQGIVVRRSPCHQQREWCRRRKDRCMFDIKRHATSSRNRRPVSLGGSRRCPQRSLVLGGNYAVGNVSCSWDLLVESRPANVTCALGICPSLGCRILTAIMPLAAKYSCRVLETVVPNLALGTRGQVGKSEAPRRRDQGEKKMSFCVLPPRCLAQLSW